MTGSSALLFCFQAGSGVVSLLTMDCLIFGIQKFPVTCFALPCSFYPTQCLGFDGSAGFRVGGWCVSCLPLP